MIDTSALLAAVIVDHEHHGLARPRLLRQGAIPAIVLAETFAPPRRGRKGQGALQRLTAPRTTSRVQW